MTTATAKFTWIKLKNGSWGVTGPDHQSGRVTGTKKSGETKSATIAKKVWGDGTKAIYAIASSSSGSGGRSGGRSGWYAPRVSAGHWECPICGEENPYSSRYCWECGCGQ